LTIEKQDQLASSLPIVNPSLHSGPICNRQFPTRFALPSARITWPPAMSGQLQRKGSRFLKADG
jgi:hypothetical protein